jgi:hypothetical protein
MGVVELFISGYNYGMGKRLQGYPLGYVEEDRSALSIAEIKRRLSPETKEGLYAMYKRGMLPVQIVEYFKLEQWGWGVVDGGGVRSVMVDTESPGSPK